MPGLRAVRNFMRLAFAESQAPQPSIKYLPFNGEKLNQSSYEIIYRIAAGIFVFTFIKPTFS